jgi:hypothetical protein
MRFELLLGKGRRRDRRAGRRGVLEHR